VPRSGRRSDADGMDEGADEATGSGGPTRRSHGRPREPSGRG